jgi:hypothetical protein
VARKRATTHCRLSLVCGFGSRHYYFPPHFNAMITGLFHYLYQAGQLLLSTRKLFVTENTPGTPLAAMYASWLSI